ncbi:MAG: serine/threonine-protein kinase [Gemmatimonadota bacterium]
MTDLPDEVLAHLRSVLDSPEIPGDRYLPLEAIAQGGMGTIYRTHDRTLDREVALKVLRAELSGDILAERLRREARILARLEHPGIVPVHDAGMLADGRVFYVMKLVRGQRLDEFASHATRNDVLRAFLRVCEAVGFAHAEGVVHRDLKPANVMVGAFGEVLVLDWGIARLVREGRERAGGESAVPRETVADDTSSGTVLGTFGFMAPEQAAGAVDRVDGRSDVYSLGAVLRQLIGPAPPRPLASICDRASAQLREERYPDVAELAAEVTRYLDGVPVQAHRESPLERVGRAYLKYQTPIILVLSYLAMRMLFLLWRDR